jgi:hypothetical protein
MKLDCFENEATKKNTIKNKQNKLNIFNFLCRKLNNIFNCVDEIIIIIIIINIIITVIIITSNNNNNINNNNNNK